MTAEGERRNAAWHSATFIPGGFAGVSRAKSGADGDEGDFPDLEARHAGTGTRLLARWDFEPVAVCIDSAKTFGREFAGRELDESFFEDLPKDVDPCGENGEFHTFVYDGPIFQEGHCGGARRSGGTGRILFLRLEGESGNENGKRKTAGASARSGDRDDDCAGRGAADCAASMEPHADWRDGVVFRSDVSKVGGSRSWLPLGCCWRETFLSAFYKLMVDRLCELCDQRGHWPMAGRKTRQLAHVGGAVLLGALQFFVVTNFAVWALGGYLSEDRGGAGECFAAGVAVFLEYACR